MKISVRVKPNSKEKKIEKVSESSFNLWIKAPAKEGKANVAVIDDLSEYFDIAKSRISIIKGQKNKNKIIEIS